MKKLLLAVAAPALLAGCTIGLECTEIGCSPFSVTIQVMDSAQAPITEFDAVITVNGVEHQCSGGTAGALQCFGSSIGVASAAETIHVRITERGTGRHFDQDVSPEYEVSRPNGELCEPECRNATVKAVLR